MICLNWEEAIASEQVTCETALCNAVSSQLSYSPVFLQALLRSG